jgi:predicted transcriptional regulator
MASSTTLKLTDDLKRRIAPLAKSAGKTPHAWMVEALEVQAALAERRRQFVASAHAAEQEVAKYGLVYEADEVFAYIESKAAGNKPKPPKPVKRS